MRFDGVRGISSLLTQVRCRSLCALILTEASLLHKGSQYERSVLVSVPNLAALKTPRPVIGMNRVGAMNTECYDFRKWLRARFK